jgi:hypothetical protein
MIVASLTLVASPANAATLGSSCAYSKSYSHALSFPTVGTPQWTFHFDITVSNDSSCTNFQYSPSVYATYANTDWPLVWYYRGVARASHVPGSDYTETILREGEFDDILTGVSNLPYPALYPAITWTVSDFDGTATASDSIHPGLAGGVGA